MEMYDSHSGTESEDDEQSTHKRHVQYRRARHYGPDRDSSVDHHEKYWPKGDEGLQVIRLVNDRSRKALNYITYRLAYNLSTWQLSRSKRC